MTVMGIRVLRMSPKTRNPRAGPGMTVMGVPDKEPYKDLHRNLHRNLHRMDADGGVCYIFGRVARRWDIPRVRWRSCSRVSWPYFLM